MARKYVRARERTAAEVREELVVGGKGVKDGVWTVQWGKKETAGGVAAEKMK